MNLKGKVEIFLKILKKIGSALLVLGLLVASPLAASASSGINANEQRILDALSTPIQLEGRSTTLPAQYINQARNYSLRADVDITSSQADEIIGYINEGRALAEGSGYSYFSEMPASLQNQLLALAQKAAAVLGLTISFDFNTGIVTIISESGDVVVDGSGVIKQTGFDFSTSSAVMIALMGVVGTCAVVAKKRNLFAAQ